MERTAGGGALKSASFNLLSNFTTM